jgi:hypothetical protein
MIHVWMPAPHEKDTYCGVEEADMIEPEELRRRVHTLGRKQVEPTICPACYAKARPKDKYASHWKNPGKPR